MKYKNPVHAIFFKTFVIQSQYKLSNRFLSAVFLLSADKDLWLKAKRGIKGKEIHFDEITNGEFGCYAYTLFSLARDFYESGSHVSLYDLGDIYLFSERTVDLIIEAVRISRGGYEYLGIKKEFN